MKAITAAICAFALFAAIADESTNVIQRAKVEVAQPSSMSVSAQSIAAAELSHETVAEIIPVEAAQKTVMEVAQQLMVQLASASESQIASLTAALIQQLSKLDSDQFNQIVQQSQTKMTVDGLKALAQVVVFNKWYNRFQAVPGSKMYWILEIAKAKDEAGQDTSNLEMLFKQALDAWTSESND